MRRLGVENLIPLDWEIKKTLKRIRKGKREATQMEQQPLAHMEGFGEEEVGSRREGSVHPDVETMDTHLSTIMDYALPPSVTPPVIRRPEIQANNFKLKSIIIQLLQGIQFRGLAYEDPNAHILNFLEVCDIMV